MKSIGFIGVIDNGRDREDVRDRGDRLAAALWRGLTTHNLDSRKI